MSDDDLPSVSITLSQAQIETVVRAAAQGNAPGISALVARGMGALRDGDAGVGVTMANWSDPRFSRSLARGLSLLLCFKAEGEWRGVVEMAEELEMSPSTAHRYILTLLQLGLLERSPETRKYRLPTLAYGETV